MNRLSPAETLAEERALALLYFLAGLCSWRRIGGRKYGLPVFDHVTCLTFSRIQNYLGCGRRATYEALAILRDLKWIESRRLHLAYTAPNSIHLVIHCEYLDLEVERHHEKRFDRFERKRLKKERKKAKKAATTASTPQEEAVFRRIVRACCKEGDYHEEPLWT